MKRLVDEEKHTNGAGRLSRESSVSVGSVSVPPTVSEESSIYDVWPKPEPLCKQRQEVLPLPIECLPESIRPWLVDVSERMQAPIDYVAIPFLIMVSSVIGTGCGIRPKSLDNWEVVPNLWGGIVGPPSKKKSPALSEALKPLYGLEAVAKDQFECESQAYETEKYTHALALEDAKNNLKKTLNKNFDPDLGVLREQAEHTLQQLQANEPQPLVMRRYRTNDTTVEKACELMAANERGILIQRDELIGFLRDMEKRGQESARSTYLQAWTGSEPYVQDRIGRGTVSVDKLCLSVIGGIQPARLVDYFASSQSTNNDGLMQRFQLLVYPDTSDFEWVDREPDKVAAEKVNRLIETLAHTDFIEFRAQQEEGSTPYFRFSNEAQEKFIKWYGLYRHNVSREDSPMIEEHLGKYESLVPSLALIFHLCDVVTEGDSGPVSLRALNNALQFSLYLESHARCIYSLSVDLQYECANQLAKKIQAGKLDSGFTVRDVYRKGWHLLKDPKRVAAACQELVELGWLAQQGTKTGATIYLINPRVNIYR